MGCGARTARAAHHMTALVFAATPLETRVCVRWGNSVAHCGHGCYIHALHDVEQLSEQTSAQRLLRRVQNEMQMLLYTHALNADRSPAINSFWVSGCGALPARTHNGVQVHTTLRESFLQQHPPAWAAAWEELAHTLMAPALQQGDSLVLCGTDRCLTLTANSPSLWQQFLQKIRPQSWVKLLS